MLGTSLQFGRRHGDDRFYDASKARRIHRTAASAAAPAMVSRAKSAGSTDSREPENRAGSEDSRKPLAVQSSPASSASNLHRFLESTIPSVPAQYLSKAVADPGFETSMMRWRSSDAEYMPYFNLGDLWESFKEWSAYGAGVPLVLNDNDSVVQYYVPYLSAMQLYRESSRRAVCTSGRPGEECDADSRDSSSDGSSDWELEDKLSLKNTALQDGFSGQDGESETGNSMNCLLFEYLEYLPPYSREPLADKVYDLASRFSELRTLRSCDLSPTSWISVAWYPIYRIPTGPTLKDLDACFLTFHSLSTPMTGANTGSGPTVTYPQGADGVPVLSLPVFGLASYKFKGSIWAPFGGSERPLASSLMQDACNWLRLLNVTHPDYQFFASHGAFSR